MEPSEEGKKRWPENDGYDEDGNPCTCKPECPYNCKGECGCKFCAAAWRDFLSEE